MKIPLNQVRAVLLALVAFSMSKAEVSAGTFSNQTSLGGPTTDPKAASINLMRQLTIQEIVEQMGQACPAIPDLSIPAYNWWSEGTNSYQAPDAYFVILPPSEANDPGGNRFSSSRWFGGDLGPGPPSTSCGRDFNGSARKI
jgi:hypothetical protein